MKHVPQRTCIVCKKQRDRSELLRIVRDKNGTVALDISGHAPGRGAYVCADGDCIHSAAKKKALDRAYKTAIDLSVYEQIAAQAAVARQADNER